MKVLMPIDFSESSESVLRVVERRPWPAGTEIAVLHVVDTVSVANGWLDLSPYIESQTEAAQGLTVQAAKRLGSTGLRVTDAVRCGHPPSAIIDYAVNWGADLVVLGSQGLSALARFLLGGVAKSVLQGTHCSVEIVRTPSTRDVGVDMRILLATDGSPYSLCAAKSIAERPWPKGTVVEVLAVAEVVPTAPDPWYAAGQIVEKLQVERLKAAKQDAKEADEILSTAGLKVLSKVVCGYPKASILDESKEWGADLIVLGSHGRRGLKRLLLGSVAEAVALHSNCSVEVIKDRSQKADFS
jgi:nucleotide-binding universal stress UspA family protein